MIVAFSGKKQSGKNTCCNFALGTFMWNESLIDKSYQITERGELAVSDLFGDPELSGILDYYSDDEGVQSFLSQEVHPVCKIYAVADSLKKDVLMDVLGMSKEAVYGTDDQKNQLSNITWDSISHLADAPKDFVSEFMTNRQVAQFIGSDVFRAMYQDVWIDKTINKINKENSMYPLICDVRFPNEVSAIQKAGGVVIRLTRQSDSQDQHISETALDEFTGFDFVIDNRDMTIQEQNLAVMSVLGACGLPIQQGAA
jgi:hypothetical protein